MLLLKTANIKQGFSLIEVMVATLILTIVFLSATQFFASPPALLEARQQAATLEAAGVLQRLFAQWPEEHPSAPTENGIWLEYTYTGFPTVTPSTRLPFPDTESFFYELYITNGIGTLSNQPIATITLYKRGHQTASDMLQLLLPNSRQ